MFIGLSSPHENSTVHQVSWPQRSEQLSYVTMVPSCTFIFGQIPTVFMLKSTTHSTTHHYYSLSVNFYHYQSLLIDQLITMNHQRF